MLPTTKRVWWTIPLALLTVGFAAIAVYVWISCIQIAQQIHAISHTGAAS